MPGCCWSNFFFLPVPLRSSVFPTIITLADHILRVLLRSLSKRHFKVRGLFIFMVFNQLYLCVQPSKCISVGFSVWLFIYNHSTEAYVLKSMKKISHTLGTLSTFFNIENCIQLFHWSWWFYFSVDIFRIVATWQRPCSIICFCNQTCVAKIVIFTSKACKQSTASYIAILKFLVKQVLFFSQCFCFSVLVLVALVITI